MTTPTPSPTSSTADVSACCGAPIVTSGPYPKSPQRRVCSRCLADPDTLTAESLEALKRYRETPRCRFCHAVMPAHKPNHLRPAGCREPENTSVGGA